MVNLTQMLSQAKSGRYAVGAFNIYDAESVQAVVEAAQEERSPVIMITGPMEVPLLGLKDLTDVCNLLTVRATIPICLHLDHFTDPESVIRAVEAGFPSVMIDGSNLSYEENIRITKHVVDFARPREITVEGELGRIGKAELSIENGIADETTDMEKAKEFVARTCIDALAVNIGNAHGIYRETPKLNFEGLQKIANAVSVPLVLHGGSSTPAPDIQKLVSIGIQKVNVATELHVAFSKVLNGDLAIGNGFTWASSSLQRVKTQQKELIKNWMRLLGSSGRV